MPISFKPSLPAIFYKKTPQADLLPCEVCGGPNLMGKVAQDLQCPACDGTGYSNYFTTLQLAAHYTPRAYTRFNSSEGGLVSYGEAQIKVSAVHLDHVEASKYVHVKGTDWNFQRMHIPGQSFGQERIILALTRR